MPEIALAGLAGTIGEAGAGSVVSAAGTIAGGEAANALMGNTQAPPGGGIPGLTTSIGSGKTGDVGSATQIDPKTALNYFQDAAQQFSQTNLQGLQYYTNQLNTAIQSMTTGAASSNQTLTPLSNASNQALSQELQMMGLTPATPTANASENSLAAMGTQYAGLAGQMSAAESLNTPEQRAQAQAQIMTNFNNQTQQDQTNLTNDQNNLNALNGKGSYVSTTYNDWVDHNLDGGWTPNSGLTQDQYNLWLAGEDSVITKPYTTTTDIYNGNPVQGLGSVGMQNQVANAVTYQADQSAITKDQAALNSQQAASTPLNTWSNNYDPNKVGYTGTQAAAQLAATPGYNFTLQQGLNSVNASQAATGMLNSGNTNAATQQYAQGLANQTYSQYMGNLSNIVNQGAPATAGIASNQSSLGNNIANAYSQLGQTGNNTYNQIATAQYNALTNEGQVWNQDMLANMQAQNAAIMQARGLASAQGIAGMNAGVALSGQAQSSANSNAVGQGLLNYGGGGGGQGNSFNPNTGMYTNYGYA